MLISDDLTRWLYRGKKQGRIARLINHLGGLAFAAGVWPSRAGTLEVPGRKSGRMTTFPVVIADYEGQRYLVSMLGDDTNWVRNVRANQGRAVLRHGRVESVRLEEVEVAKRAPILRRYLELAPGARPHIAVDRLAPLSEFEKIAGQLPVFRICPA